MALVRLPAIRVTSRVRGGSSSPVIVETPGGTFVAKLRGAGHGVFALVAEILVAELAQCLELPVPERVLIELSPDVPSDDRNDELADLLGASTGTNLGLRLLDGAREPRQNELQRLDDEFAARVLWLDGLVQNPDRTLKNPNILLWHGQPWLIDHGTALPFHHDWATVTEAAPREPTDHSTHVFADRVASLHQKDAALAHRLTRQVLEATVATVPETFLAVTGPETSLRRNRAAYVAFLWKRLKKPRPFVTASEV